MTRLFCLALIAIAIWPVGRRNRRRHQASRRRRREQGLHEVHRGGDVGDRPRLRVALVLCDANSAAGRSQAVALKVPPLALYAEGDFSLVSIRLAGAKRRPRVTMHFENWAPAGSSIDG